MGGTWQPVDIIHKSNLSRLLGISSLFSHRYVAPIVRPVLEYAQFPSELLENTALRA